MLRCAPAWCTCEAKETFTSSTFSRFSTAVRERDEAYVSFAFHVSLAPVAMLCMCVLPLVARNGRSLTGQLAVLPPLVCKVLEGFVRDFLQPLGCCNPPAARTMRRGGGVVVVVEGAHSTVVLLWCGNVCLPSLDRLRRGLFDLPSLQPSATCYGAILALLCPSRRRGS